MAKDTTPSKGSTKMKSLVRVLHLEDSPRDAELIQETLKIGGLPCEIVLANGKEGFEPVSVSPALTLEALSYPSRSWPSRRSRQRPNPAPGPSPPPR